MNARSVSPQLCLGGMAAWFKPTVWEPRPALLVKIKSYFEGYARTSRPIFGSRPYIAGKLKISVRTLARYLRYLRETGWLATIERKARYCIRRVLAAVPSFVPSLRRRPFSDVTSRGKSAPAPKKTLYRAITDWRMCEKLCREGVPYEEAKRRATS